MNRRDFLKLTGLAGVAAAVGTEQHEDAPEVIEYTGKVEVLPEINPAEQYMLGQTYQLVQMGIVSKGTYRGIVGLNS